MAMRQNIFNSGASPLAASLQNLTQSFFSGPTQAQNDADAARAEASRASAGVDRQKLADAQSAASARASLPDLMRSIYGNVGNVEGFGVKPEAFVGPPPAEDLNLYTRPESEIDMTGALFQAFDNPQQSANAVSTLMSNLLAAGGPSEQNQVFTRAAKLTPDQALRNDLAVQAAKPQTETEARALAFGALPADMQATAVGPSETEAKGGALSTALPGMADEQRLRVLGAEDTRTPRNWVHPLGSGITLDGVTDASTGKPIPSGASVYTGQLQGTGNETGLRPTVVGGLQEDQLAAKNLRGLIDYTRNLAGKSELNFGFPGFVKGAAQDTAALLTGVTTAMGYKNPSEAVATARRDATAAGISPELLNGVFDPNLPALHTASDLLVFQAAAALAGQSGRSVSDRDVKFFKDIVGSPGSFLTSQEKFVAKLGTIEEILGLREGVTNAALGGPKAAPQPRDAAGAGSAIQDARDAIAKGADPAAVAARLQEMGIDPSALGGQ